MLCSAGFGNTRVQHGAGMSMSLVEQKRLQWAKEREELEGLCGLWGRDPSRSRADHIGVPAALAALAGSSSTSSTTTNLLQRRPSLPPIRRPSLCRGNSTPEEVSAVHEEGSSGYASDSAAGQEQLAWEEQHEQPLLRQASPGETPHQAEQQRRAVLRGGWTHQVAGEQHRLSGTGSSVSGSSVSSWAEEAGRARWGDRGVGVGHLWEPAGPSGPSGPSAGPSDEESAARLPPVAGLVGGVPSWLHRGLRSLRSLDCDSQVTSQVLVLSHPDSPGSGTPPASEPDDQLCRSFLRGQNVPLEADILEERQRRRQKALEHQTAIRQQLEERDRRRKEERERKLREERLEEERVRREQEEERMRREHEQRRQRDKEEQESRRASAMLEALQEAERQAKEHKTSQSHRHVAERRDDRTPRTGTRTSPRTPRTNWTAGHGENASSDGEVVVQVPKTRSPRGSVTSEEGPSTSSLHGSSTSTPAATATAAPASAPAAAAASTPAAAAAAAACTPAATPSCGDPGRRAEADGAADLAEKLASLHVAESAVACQDGNRGWDQDEQVEGPGEAAAAAAAGWFPVLEFLQPQEVKPGMPPIMPFGEGLALVVPAGVAGAFSSRDSAHTHTNPRAMGAPQQVALLSMAEGAPGAHWAPRLLTPTKFRRRMREVATQTSAGLRRRGGARPSSGGRTRQGSRVPKGRLQQQVGERPKWGVNRPGTEYRTQSEKDPNYQQQRLQRLQRLHQRMLRQLRASACSNSSRSPSPSNPGGSPSCGDLLSRTYRICRGEAGEASSSGQHDHKQQPASFRMAEEGSPAHRPNRRVSNTSRPGRFSVREDSGGSSGGSPSCSGGSRGGGSGASSSPGGGEDPGVDADEEVDQASPRNDDVLSRLSSLRQGLVLKREQLADLESVITSISS